MSEVLEALQEAEERAFYRYTAEIDPEMKCRFKAVDVALRAIIQEVADLATKEKCKNEKS
jgi:hypothetical protein